MFKTTIAAIALFVISTSTAAAQQEDCYGSYTNDPKTTGPGECLMTQSVLIPISGGEINGRETGQINRTPEEIQDAEEKAAKERAEFLAQQDQSGILFVGGCAAFLFVSAFGFARKLRQS